MGSVLVSPQACFSGKEGVKEKGENEEVHLLRLFFFFRVSDAPARELGGGKEESEQGCCLFVFRVFYFLYPRTSRRFPQRGW